MRDRVLTQEILLYLGVLIRERPELFGELLTLRVSHFILLLTSQLAREQDISTGEAYDALMALAPSVVQQRLEGVLEQYHAIEDLPQQLEQLQAQAARGALDWKQDLGLEKLRTPREGWLAWRQLRGIIDRRPAALLRGRVEHLPACAGADHRREARTPEPHEQQRRAQ